MHVVASKLEELKELPGGVDKVCAVAVPGSYPCADPRGCAHILAETAPILMLHMGINLCIYLVRR